LENDHYQKHFIRHLFFVSPVAKFDEGQTLLLLFGGGNNVNMS
jgi:hypothetical protein